MKTSLQKSQVGQKFGHHFKTNILKEYLLLSAFLSAFFFAGFFVYENQSSKITRGSKNTFCRQTAYWQT
jgi:hypothetical protein